MNIHKFQMPWIVYFITLLIILLLLYSISMFLLFSKNYSLLFLASPNTSIVGTRESSQPIINQIYFDVLPVNPTIKDTEPTQEENSYLHNWQGLIYDRVNDYLLIFINSILLFFHCFLSLTRKTSKRVSVISLSIGGHAPPL